MTTLIQLRHMQLEPPALQLPLHAQLRLKITHNNTSSLTSGLDTHSRKFLFAIEETEEETPPLVEGEQYLFAPLTEAGNYHLVCLNYPKISCSITVLPPPALSPVPPQPQPSQAPPTITAVQPSQQKPMAEVEKGGELGLGGQLSRLGNYEKLLQEDELVYDSMPNKCLKYFKEEFKLWRNFFGEEGREKSGSHTQDVVSSGSLSLSGRESQKDKSVVSQLRSQQEMSELQEELTANRIMKKTNSEYGFNVGREVEKPTPGKRKQMQTKSSSPLQKSEYSAADTFVDWACGWAEETGQEKVAVRRKGDAHLVKQWLAFLQNKFRISEFLHASP